MKVIMGLIFIVTILSCGNSSIKQNSIELIANENEQNTLFNQLMTIIGKNVSSGPGIDSMAVLIVPVQASCPTCRNKTIDSIIKHRYSLLPNHFIVISAKGGRKTMSSYFRDRNVEIPDIPDQLILDSTNQAYQYNLFKDNPAIYYTASSKAYKKIFSKPATVKQDLQEFFSGWRNDMESR